MADVKVLIVSSMMTRNVLESIADALSNRGLSVAVSGDAAAEITGVDCVIVRGTGLELPILTHRLEAQEPDRPAVIAWLSEPLPPDGTTRAMLGIGRALSPARFPARWVMQLEAMFSDFKTRGFGIAQSQIKKPDRLERLILVMAIAMYWAVSTGAADEQIVAESGEKRGFAKPEDHSAPSSNRACGSCADAS